MGVLEAYIHVAIWCSPPHNHAEVAATIGGSLKVIESRERIIKEPQLAVLAASPSQAGSSL